MIETNFKHTEIGLIPHDWEVFSVGNDCYIKARIGWQGLTTAEYLDHGEYGLITSTDIVDGKINWNTCWFVSEDRYRQDAKIQVRGNDVLISKDGTIGKVGIVKELPYPATLNSGVFVIRTNNSQQSQKGLSLAFISPFFADFIKRLTAGSTIVHLYQKDIVNYQYPLPPTVTEQERIVDALSSIDTLIGALNEQIEKKRHIKQGTMQQLLTGKKRLAGFTGEWTEVRLGDVAKLKSGYAFKSTTYFNIGTFKIITIANVQNGVLDMSDYNKIVEIPSNIQEHQILKEGDILVSMTGNVGRVCRVDCKNCLLNQRVGVFALKNTIDAEYLYVILNNLEFEKEMIGKGHGAAQPNIGSSDVESYCFVVPPTIAEQSAIAEVLSGMDTEIAALEQKRDKYIAIKSGMMQDLLTGKIRLV